MFTVKYTGENIDEVDIERVQHLIIGKEYLVGCVHHCDEVLYSISEVKNLISSRYFKKEEDQNDMEVILNMVKSLSDEMLDNEYEKRENSDKKTSSERIMDSILERIPEDVIIHEMSRRGRIRSALGDIPYDNKDYTIKKVPVILTAKYEILKKEQVVGIIEVCGDDVIYIPKPDFVEKNVLGYITSIIKYIVKQEKS